MSYNPPSTPRCPRPPAKRAKQVAQPGQLFVSETVQAFEDPKHRGYVFFDINSTTRLHGLCLNIEASQKKVYIYLKDRETQGRSNFISNTKPNTFSATMTHSDGRVIEKDMNVIFMPKNPFCSKDDVRLQNSYIRFGPDDRTQHVFYPIGHKNYHP